VNGSAPFTETVARIIGDGRVLWRLLRGQPSGANHTARLNAFYGPQADRYDAFRERLLPGRDLLLNWLGKRLEPGAHLVELGAGTGRNPAFLGTQLADLGRVELVDLCSPLLEQARYRWAEQPNVRVVEADACRYRPDEEVDAVFFAYALSMIPNWFEAVDNALAMLRPGGLLGAVDFYVSRSQPDPGRVRHSAATRWFWPAWFGHDGVSPNPDHLPYLESRLQILCLREEQTPVPYLPALRAPYYLLLGRKPAAHNENIR
jgi:S-adenosylmethionine-diacylgycerolhomoserine-N-methlytransferase